MKQTHLIYVFLWFVALSACTYTEKIVDSRTALERKQFAVAAKLIEKEFMAAKDAKVKSKLAVQVGECYNRINQTNAAKVWFDKAAANDAFNINATRELAYIAKREQQYDVAAKAFDVVGKETGDPAKYRKEVSACRISAGWLKEVAASGIIVLPQDALNTAVSDFAPVFSADGNLTFSSDRVPTAEATKKGKKTENTIYGWTGRSYSNLYQTDQNKTNVTPLADNINTAYNEGAACFNPTFTEMYFTRCGSDTAKNIDYCKIMRTTRTVITADWSEPTPVDVGITNYNVQHPALASNGKRLYFTSDMPEGSGGYDLFFVEQKKDGTWATEWKNAGRAINTEGNELFPSFDRDTLYFASDGHTGMGGLDIFSTFYVKNKWQPVLNLKAPVNSGEDDFGMIIDRLPRKDTTLQRAGYFTSSRKGGRGADDIYRFEQRKPKTAPPPLVPVKPNEPKIVYKVILEVNVLKKRFEQADNPNSKVSGYDAVAEASVKTESDDTTFTLQTPKTGKFEIQIKENETYSFSVDKAGFFSKNQSFNAGLIEKNPKNPITRLKLNIIIDQIFENKEITLENIYYDYDKSDIRADATPTLNELAELLRRNPNVRIQLSSHTDCRGRDTYNLSLSQARAQSAVNYLISRGLPTERLTAKGYGETQPVTTCKCTKCTEIEHQTNRRTTFKVIK